MIEIEKNFDLSPGDKQKLLNGAVLVRVKSFTDTYYDDNLYSLTSNDYWLRKRDDRFELKVPLNKAGTDRSITDQYRELENDEEIAKELKLEIRTNLEKAIADANYKPFCTITTRRESYNKNEFHLDFDEIPEMDYATLEIELMIEKEEGIQNAERRILEFANQHGISTPGQGKVIEYLMKNNPAHLNVLREKGVVR